MTMTAPAEIYASLIRDPDMVNVLLAYGQSLPPLPDGVLKEATGVVSQMKQVGPLLGLRASEVVPMNKLRRLAWTFSLVGAASRRKRWWCPHAFIPDRVTYSLLTEGASFCQSCKNKVERHLGFKDDGHCDVCDAETTVFWEFASHDTLGLFAGNMCESCHTFFMRLKDEVPG